MHEGVGHWTAREAEFDFWSRESLAIARKAAEAQASALEGALSEEPHGWGQHGAWWIVLPVRLMPYVEELKGAFVRVPVPPGCMGFMFSRPWSKREPMVLVKYTYDREAAVWDR